MEYTHSKDYLIELASNSQTHGWLKDLIIKIVNNNGMISDAELADSVIQLKTNAASVLVIPSTDMSNQNADIELSEAITSGIGNRSVDSYFTTLKELFGL